MIPLSPEPATLPQCRVRLAGLAMDVCTAAQVVDLVTTKLGHPGGGPLLVASVNLDHVHHFGPGAAQEARPIARGENWLMTVDGAPIALALRRATRLPLQRVAGADLLPELLAAAAARGHRVAFLGGMDETRAALSEALERRFPDLTVVGHWTPSRSELDDPATCTDLADRMRAAGVEMLVVGLGKPRQELWLQRYADRAGIAVGLAFGASADFLAGRAQRAPLWIREYGLEWFYRLCLEPRRLARRYLIQGPVAMLRVRRSLAAGPPIEPNPFMVVLPDTDHAIRLGAVHGAVVPHPSEPLSGPRAAPEEASSTAHADERVADTRTFT